MKLLGGVDLMGLDAKWLISTWLYREGVMAGEESRKDPLIKVLFLTLTHMLYKGNKGCDRRFQAIKIQDNRAKQIGVL